ncbi:HCL294Cp [Eremothecium sinecaudum]|uniref:HCL294Cp n=1 Tax=Eremothecium sinecaudum TaxID=45286 RepID=A0A109UYV8_9SACH|nr:HCL294Cp [Eremothecium sinecaudum]AMD19857.1 HCL294Cp [Eremothecium sinecaudum]
MSSDENRVNLKQRMVSALAGSLTTALILTPLDVVRIRLQQQELIPSCLCVDDLKTGESLAVKPLSSGKLFWQDECFHKIDCKATATRFTSTWEALMTISRTEGFTTLWRGLSLTLLMAIPGNVVYFSGYEVLKEKSFLRHNHPLLNPVFCGAFARMLAAATVAPLELIRTRFQSIPRSSTGISSLSMFKDLLKETRMELSVHGYRALYRGLLLTLWRDVPFSALYWGAYEYYKQHYWINTSIIYRSKSNSWEYFFNGLIGGGISGTIATLITHPFDVGKTRMQLEVLNSEKNDKKSTGGNKTTNIFRFLNNIRRTEGIKALYTGLVPRVAKVTPSCAIMISTYELSKKYFTS